MTINPSFPVIYQVTEIDGYQGFVIDTIPVGLVPTGIAFNSNNGYVYVTNQIDNTVSVIDPATNTVVGAQYRWEGFLLELHSTRTTGFCTWQTKTATPSL